MKLNRIPFSSLHGRIFAIFWFTIFIVVLSVIAIKKMDPRQSHEIQKEVLSKIERQVNQLERKYAKSNDLRKAILAIDRGEWSESSNRRNNIDFKFYIVDSSSNILSKEGGMKRRALQNFITRFIESEQPHQQLFGRFMVAGPFPVVIADAEFSIYAGFKWDQPPPFLLNIIDNPLQMLLVVMLVSTPLLLSLAWALSQPARRLELAAKRVATGEFIADPNLEKGSCEFKQTGKSFNQMVLSINQMVSGQQKLLSDISHELRSPLTRLRMANALATRKQGASKESQRIDMEADRLEKMISELLKLSRMQIDSHLERETLTLEQLYGELLDNAKFEAEQSNIAFVFSSLPKRSINGNPNLLMSAVENIIRNAIHYADSHVSATFAVNRDHLAIFVEDDGSGVPDSELTAIFRPFYRVDEARDRDSGGAGLGLAITSSAITQHNGTIAASRSELGGLRVEITLPLSS